MVPYVFVSMIVQTLLNNWWQRHFDYYCIMTKMLISLWLTGCRGETDPWSRSYWHHRRDITAITNQTSTIAPIQLPHFFSTTLHSPMHMYVGDDSFFCDNYEAAWTCMSNFFSFFLSQARRSCGLQYVVALLILKSFLNSLAQCFTDRGKVYLRFLIRSLVNDVGIYKSADISYKLLYVLALRYYFDSAGSLL